LLAGTRWTCKLAPRAAGGCSFYPQFSRSPLEVVKDAEAEGAQSAEEITRYAVKQLRDRKLRFAVEDPDAPENWPRVWFIWRGNALMASAKGHEYFLKHYLGTHTNAIAEDMAHDSVKEVKWYEQAPTGKMDLVVDLNFRMDTSALYSDIVLPAATWYEKADLNSTDMHSFIHPLSAAIPPCWESKSDWQIFRAIARKFSELAARHFPQPVRDLVATPLAHDTPAEIAQPDIKDWARGEVDAVPGVTMPGLKVITRDYKNVYNQFTSLGPQVRENGLGAHGTHYAVADLYDETLIACPTVSWDGQIYAARMAPDGTGYPTLWEDQDNYKGGWEAKDGKLALKSTSKVRTFFNIYHNPNMPTMDDYYEPWTYDYQHLFNAPEGPDQPTALPLSMVTGKPIEVEAGPNWDDDLGGSPVYAEHDPNLDGLSAEQRAQLSAVERLVFFYFPRICNHCLNPSCVAACPSGALYKRGEDGIVLLDQKRCRGWRACVAACRYKKTFYNWSTGKSEKCILCFPRLETGQAPACFHSCVGRIRYLGAILYDAERIEAIAKRPNEELVEAHRSMILDPSIQRSSPPPGAAASTIR
jgi:Fe-S-cluster-containing dehydrogenase component